MSSRYVGIEFNACSSDTITDAQIGRVIHKVLYEYVICPERRQPVIPRRIQEFLIQLDLSLLQLKQVCLGIAYKNLDALHLVRTGVRLAGLQFLMTLSSRKLVFGDHPSVVECRDC